MEYNTISTIEKPVQWLPIPYQSKVQSHPYFFSSGAIFAPAEGLILSSEFWLDCCTVCHLIRICIGQSLDGREAQEITFSLIPLSGNECNYEALASGEGLGSMFGVFWLHVPFPWQEAECGYVIIVMALFWCTEALPLSVTALLPVLLFPLMNIMDSTTVRDLAPCIPPSSSFILGLFPRIILLSSSSSLYLYCL